MDNEEDADAAAAAKPATEYLGKLQWVKEEHVIFKKTNTKWKI